MKGTKIFGIDVESRVCEASYGISFATASSAMAGSSISAEGGGVDTDLATLSSN